MKKPGKLVLSLIVLGLCMALLLNPVYLPSIQAAEMLQTTPLSPTDIAATELGLTPDPELTAIPERGCKGCRGYSHSSKFLDALGFLSLRMGQFEGEFLGYDPGDYVDRIESRAFLSKRLGYTPLRDNEQSYLIWYTVEDGTTEFFRIERNSYFSHYLLARMDEAIVMHEGNRLENAMLDGTAAVMGLLGGGVLICTAIIIFIMSLSFSTPLSALLGVIALFGGCIGIHFVVDAFWRDSMEVAALTERTDSWIHDDLLSLISAMHRW